MSDDYTEDIQFCRDYNDLNEFEKIDCNAFVGPLVSKNAVKTYGVANGSLFIYGDDTEFTYRISKSLNNYLIKSALIDHQDVPKDNNVTKPSFWWKDYYALRNRFFIVDEFSTSTFSKYKSKFKLSIKAARGVAAALVKPSYKNYRLLRIKILSKALKDGLCNRMGKVIDPKDYLKELKRKKHAL